MIACDAPASEVRFANAGDEHRFSLERRVADQWLTITTISSDSFSFMVADEHVEVTGRPDVSGE